MENTKRFIDYCEIKKLFDEQYKQTKRLIQNGETHLDNLAEGFSEADHIIRDLPDVDAVEVIRCKDCKHKRVIFGRPPSAVYVCSHNHGLGDTVKEDDFCSYGEV